MNPTLRKMRVLESFGSGGPRTNPYLIQLARALEGYVDVIPFSWRAALFGDFDVFHVHWPELLIRGRSRVKTLGRLVLFSFLLLRIRVSHVAVVRTAHNTAAHESGHRGEKQLLGQLDFLTDFVIQLNPATTSPNLKRSRVVLHGDYRDWFAHVDVPPSVPGRVLYFGLIRRYKGVEALLESFAAVPDRNWRLHITGRPDSPEFALDIMTVAARDDRVRVQFGYLPDERLADEIGRAEIVVLPYKMMQNSGAALLALSLGRPVLIPSGESTRSLREEVGSDWVHLYDGTIDSVKLVDALSAVRQPRTTVAPDLRARTWSEIGSLHAEIFAEAMGLSKSVRGARRKEQAAPKTRGKRS